MDVKTRPTWIVWLVASGLVLASCASKDSGGNSGATTTTTTSTASPDTAAPGTSASSTTAATTGHGGSSSTTQVAAGVIVVKTDTDSQLGEVLVDGKGVTLYVYNKDGHDSSTCTGACAKSWIPLTGTSIQAGGGLSEADFTLIDRGDGTRQASFKGHPLYHFASDTKPGQSNGQGVNRTWYAIGPDGNPISRD